jgi:hypothetical protein
MILYHFTGLRQLIGSDAPARVRPRVDFDDMRALAAPGSILASGLKPHLDAQMPMIDGPVVWLTSNPDMPRGLNTWSGWRISVAIPDKDRRLLRFVDALSAVQPVMSSKGLPDALQAEGDQFYAYFGAIPLRRFVDVEQCQQPIGEFAMPGVRRTSK